MFEGETKMKPIIALAAIAVLLFSAASALEESYSSDQCFNKADELYNGGSYNESLRYAEKALEINQSNDQAWNLKGRILIKLSRYNDSMACFNRALEINPNYANASSNIGIALINLGDEESAIAYFDKAIEIDPLCKLAWEGEGAVL